MRLITDPTWVHEEYVMSLILWKPDGKGISESVILMEVPVLASEDSIKLEDVINGISALLEAL